MKSVGLLMIVDNYKECWSADLQVDINKKKHSWAILSAVWLKQLCGKVDEKNLVNVSAFVTLERSVMTS